jgi:hypothetical protein
MINNPITMISTQDYIRVESTYDYNFLILPSFVQNLGIKKTLKAHATMRAE